MSKLSFYVVCVAIGSLAFFNKIATSDSDSFYKPFNYRAFEARKKGHSIVIPKAVEAMTIVEPLKNLPSWPGYLRIPNPERQSIAYSEIKFSWASRCFNERSELKDISALQFGTDRPQLQDISLIARLHNNSLRDWLSSGKPPKTITPVSPNLWSWITRNTSTTSSSNPEIAEFTGSPLASVGSLLAQKFLAYDRYLTFLAEKELMFKSKLREPAFTFNYQTSFFENMLTVGIEVPIVYKSQEVNMIAENTVTEKTILNGAGTNTTTGNIATNAAPFPKAEQALQDFFFSQYSSFKDFYSNLLLEKNLSSDPKTTRFGIGDISFIVNRRICSDYWTLGLAGFALTLNTAGKSSKRSVWPVELGNGGFFEGRIHGAFYFKQSSLVNPHVFGELRFCFPSKIEKRASVLISYDKLAQTSTIEAQDIPLGQNLIFDKNSFKNEPESTVPAFAAVMPNYENEIEYRQGATLDLRFGNVFEELLIKNGSLDIFCQAQYKFKDSFPVKDGSSLFDLESIVKNTQRWSVSFGSAYTYQWYDNVALELKAQTILFGKNVLRKHSIGLAMQLQF